MNSPAPSPFWWVEPLIVFFGIVISIAIAAFTISENRQIARKKATLDIIEASESRPFYRDLYITFLKYRNDDAFRDRILRPASDQDRAARNSCWTYLNHFELIAISIAKGVIDEEFYKSWMAYAVIRDFRAAHELIAIARAPAKPGDSGDKVAYCYLEALCQRWNQTDRMFFRPIRDP